MSHSRIFTLSAIDGFALSMDRAAR